MSAIALSWVASVQVGNSIAKNLLRFYASHNFINENYFHFANDTLAYQLEVSERSIIRAHEYLEQKGFIKRQVQFKEDGTQLPSLTILCIPNSFIDDWLNKNNTNKRPKPEGGRVTDSQGEGDKHDRGRVTESHPNNKNNNKDNNKKQKSFYENEKKHDWAESKNQMACEKKHIEEHEKRKTQYAIKVIDEIKNKLSNKMINKCEMLL